MLWCMNTYTGIQQLVVRIVNESVVDSEAPREPRDERAVWALGAVASLIKRVTSPDRLNAAIAAADDQIHTHLRGRDINKAFLAFKLKEKLEAPPRGPYIEYEDGCLGPL